jgi:hypothetical protein
MALEPRLLDWLLDSDPTLRWQVERDLAGAPPEVWEVTRRRIATEGYGAKLLALQDADGQWAGGSYFPRGHDFDNPDPADAGGQPWTATTWTLNSLRDWGLDGAVLRERRTAELLAETAAGSTTTCRTGAARSTAASTPGRWRTVCGFTAATHAARRSGEEYLLRRGLFPTTCSTRPSTSARRPIAP